MPHEERRGGRQPPDRKPRPPAGPGQQSNRQDMSQPTAVPDEPMPQGAKTRFREAQQRQPLPSRRTGPPTPGPGQGRRPPAPGGPNLMDVLARPGRGGPMTTGLPVGPGPGPEILAEPTAEEGPRLRRQIQQMTSKEMPPDFRGLGVLMGIIDQAKRAADEPVPDVTEEDIAGPPPAGEDVPPLFDQPVLGVGESQLQPFASAAGEEAPDVEAVEERVEEGEPGGGSS